MKLWVRVASRWTLAGFFVGVGVLHFVRPEGFVAIVPKLLPFPLALVYISGAAEIAGGIGVLIPQVRRYAGLGLVALLLAVFPANVNMAWNRIPMNGRCLSDAVLWGRLPVQLLLIWWVLASTRPEPGTGKPTA